MLLTKALLTAAHLFISPLHNIDFQIAPDQQGSTADARDFGRPSTPRERDEIVAKTRYSIARGFGNQVPIAFAVKQIVPPSFRIEFGNDIDPAITVTWVGDRPWNEVLWLALHSRKLRMIVQKRLVLIRK